jgi:hypothetical protein
MTLAPSDRAQVTRYRGSPAKFSRPSGLVAPHLRL